MSTLRAALGNTSINRHALHQHFIFSSTSSSFSASSSSFFCISLSRLTTCSALVVREGERGESCKLCSLRYWVLFRRSIACRGTQQVCHREHCNPLHFLKQTPSGQGGQGQDGKCDTAPSGWHSRPTIEGRPLPIGLSRTEPSKSRGKPRPLYLTLTLSRLSRRRQGELVALASLPSGSV